MKSDDGGSHGDGDFTDIKTFCASADAERKCTVQSRVEKPETDTEVFADTEYGKNYDCRFYVAKESGKERPYDEKQKESVQKPILRDGFYRKKKQIGDR